LGIAPTVPTANDEAHPDGYNVPDPVDAGGSLGIVWLAVRRWRHKRWWGFCAPALDCSGTGLLVVDRRRRIVAFNRGYAEIWNIPESVMKSGRGPAALAVARDRVKNPERFLSQVRGFYADPEARSEETLEFADVE